ncbi:MAG: hypothetical protein CSA40_01675 [Flavobacteriales bacterium]|nr:MAG: hypothetical protein CSA40_01675 [Flavobacteriales bacterium]
MEDAENTEVKKVWRPFLSHSDAMWLFYGAFSCNSLVRFFINGKNEWMWLEHYCKVFSRVTIGYKRVITNN